MVEVTSTAETDHALKDQEIAHLKDQVVELRNREAELNGELSKVAVSKSDEIKERENTIQTALIAAQKETQEANEKV